ncbi:unnamed protein product [Clonostachys rosea f. rosea IK726]|uniref:FAD-binding domain-containing protein n=2 Tax=Bionectria ochroleuca TaxID=29856 RepID=A0A0B7JWZ8_BIOOC|nr:unnamed protein product [Clonostachys rosea f. rosea IK726]
MGQKSHPLEGKDIIVAGGGVAGSAFVAALIKLWNPELKQPNIIVVERDPRDVVRQREGYSLSLTGHDDTSGLAVLKKLDLLDSALDKAVASTDNTGAFKIWGADWTEKTSLHRKPAEGLPTSTIRISRRELRGLLHNTINDKSTILWETQCISAKALDNGRVQVELMENDNKSVRYEECDLLIAADGASSKLRSYLRPDDQLEYQGAALRGGLSRFDGPLPAPLNKDWGFALSGDGVSCFYSPVDEHTVVWTVGNQEPEPLPPLDHSSEAACKAVVERGRELGALFHEPFNTIVNNTDLSAVLCINARDKMPFCHDGFDTLPVVFIGDSNHALSPFSGIGANLALGDGWELAKQICATGQVSLASAVKGYDSIIVPRTTKIVKAARRRLEMGHSTGFKLWLFYLILALSRVVGRIVGDRRK